MIEPRGQSRTVRRARMGAGTFDGMGRPLETEPERGGRGARPDASPAPGGRTHEGTDRKDAQGRAIESQKREKPPRGLPRAVFEFGS